MGLVSKICRIINITRNRTAFFIEGVSCPHVRHISGRLFIRNKGVISIGPNFRANSGFSYNPIGGDTILRLITCEGASLEIGANVGISNSTLYSACSITVEDDVNIGGGCHVYDSDFHSIRYEERMSLQDPGIRTAPVRICKGAWLGGGCTVLKGVTIGERAVIGAGSVVTKDVPADEIWAGNPARFVKSVE